MAGDLTIEGIVLVAAILGVLFRSYLPYLRKIKAVEEGIPVEVVTSGAVKSENMTESPATKAVSEVVPNIPFQRKYIFTAAFSFVTSLAGALFLWDGLLSSALLVSSNGGSYMAIFISTFIGAVGANTIINEVISRN